MRLRRLTRWTVGITSGLLLLIATSAIVVETEWFKERLRRIVVNRAAEALNGQLSVGQLTGSLLTGVELHHVVLTQTTGPVLAVETLALRYDPRILLRGHLIFSELSLTRPVVRIAERSDGWNLATLVRPTSGGGGTEIQFRKLSIVDGDLSVEPAAAAARHFTHLNAGLGLSYTADHIQVSIETLNGQDVDTGLVVRGGAAKFENSGDRLIATVNLDSSAGTIAGTIDGRPGDGGRVLEGRFAVNHLDLAPIAARRDLATDITGKLQAQAALAGSASAVSTVSFQVEAPAVSAAGYSAHDVKGRGSYSDGVLHLDAEGSSFDAHATVRGEWRTTSAPKAPNTMVLAGRVRDLDLRRLPASLQVPKIESQVAGQYSLLVQPGALGGRTQAGSIHDRGRRDRRRRRGPRRHARWGRAL